MENTTPMLYMKNHGVLVHGFCVQRLLPVETSHYVPPTSPRAVHIAGALSRTADSLRQVRSFNRKWSVPDQRISLPVS